MSFNVGDRVSVNLTGLHPIAGAGAWTHGTVTSVPAPGSGALVAVDSGYSVRVDAPLNGQADFSGITEDRLQPLG
jgi:hypothetical protein